MIELDPTQTRDLVLLGNGFGLAHFHDVDSWQFLHKGLVIYVPPQNARLYREHAFIEPMRHQDEDGVTYYQGTSKTQSIAQTTHVKDLPFDLWDDLEDLITPGILFTLLDEETNEPHPTHRIYWEPTLDELKHLTHQKPSPNPTTPHEPSLGASSARIVHLPQELRAHLNHLTEQGRFPDGPAYFAPDGMRKYEVNSGTNMMYDPTLTRGVKTVLTPSRLSFQITLGERLYTTGHLFLEDAQYFLGECNRAPVAPKTRSLPTRTDRLAA